MEEISDQWIVSVMNNKNKGRITRLIFRFLSDQIPEFFNHGTGYW